MIKSAEWFYFSADNTQVSVLRKASKALAASLGSSLGILFYILLLNIIVSLDILPFPLFLLNMYIVVWWLNCI